MTRTTPAFLLHALDLGESDRLLTFFTRQEGKIKGVARGAKKSRKRFGGALDFFHLVKLQFRPGRGELCQFDHVELISKSSRIAADLDCFAIGSYFLELVREMTPLHHADERLFDLLHQGIRRLEEKTGDPQMLKSFFEIQLMNILGFKPNLQACMLCHKPLAGRNFRFLSERGGLACAACMDRTSGLPASLKTVEILRALAAGSAESSLESSVALEIRKILDHWIALHVQKRLHSLNFMDEIQRR